MVKRFVKFIYFQDTYCLLPDTKGSSVWPWSHGRTAAAGLGLREYSCFLL